MIGRYCRKILLIMLIAAVFALQFSSVYAVQRTEEPIRFVEISSVSINDNGQSYLHYRENEDKASGREEYGHEGSMDQRKSDGSAAKSENKGDNAGDNRSSAESPDVSGHDESDGAKIHIMSPLYMSGLIMLGSMAAGFIIIRRKGR